MYGTAQAPVIEKYFETSQPKHAFHQNQSTNTIVPTIVPTPFKSNQEVDLFQLQIFLKQIYIFSIKSNYFTRFKLKIPIFELELSSQKYFFFHIFTVPKK